MGCGQNKVIKDSTNVYEFIESLEYNINLIFDEMKRLSSRSKDIYNRGKKILKMLNELNQEIKSIESFDLMQMDWESMRDCCHYIVIYYFESYSSLTTDGDDEKERTFMSEEKKLKNFRKDIITIKKNKT